jgi:uncharacterized protein YndB with AHSA1/START domain
MAMIFPPTTFEKAVSISLGVAVFLYIAASCLTNSYGQAFFSIPIFVGFVAGALYPRRPYKAAFYALFGALVLSIITLREGVVCVLFSLPLLIPMLLIGSYAGSTLARHLKTRGGRDASVLFMVVFGLGYICAEGIVDNPAHHPVHVAEASVTVAAPPEAVFAALTTKELRVENRWPWFLRIGLPMPDRMRVETAALGGRVRFDFSQGTAFARIRAFRPPYELAYGIDRYEIHDLPFHITRLGRGPHYGFRRERIEDWLTVLDTRYTLTPTPVGTVVHRRIVWRRHLAPDVYFGWLQQTVMERSQLRLLELVRSRVTEPLRAVRDRCRSVFRKPGTASRSRQ